MKLKHIDENSSMHPDDIYKSVSDTLARAKANRKPVSANTDATGPATGDAASAEEKRFRQEYHRDQTERERNRNNDRLEEEPDELAGRHTRTPEPHPYRKHGTPLNRPPVNPDYPTKSFDKKEWVKSYMKEEGEQLDELTNELLRRYKTAAAGDAGESEKTAWDPESSHKDSAKALGRSNKRFSGIVRATKKQFANDKKSKTEEGMMGGINRSAPATDVSYEKVLNDSVMQDVQSAYGATTQQAGPIGFILIDPKDGDRILGKYGPTQRSRANARRDKLDNQYGAYRYRVKPVYPGEEHLLKEMGPEAQVNPPSNQSQKTIYNKHEWANWSQDAAAKGLTVRRNGDRVGDNTVGYDKGSGDPNAILKYAPQYKSRDGGDSTDALDKNGNIVGHWTAGSDGATTGGVLGNSPDHYQQIINKGYGQTVQPSNDAAQAKRTAMGIDENKHRVRTAATQANQSNFTDILNKQHQDKTAPQPAKAVSIPFHGWEIKYKPNSNGQVDWVIIKKDKILQKGVAASDKEAVGAAEEWIKQGAGEKKDISKNATIDFNSKFVSTFAPSGETFYSTFISQGGQPYLVISHEPHEGLQKSSIRAGSNFPCIHVTPKVARPVGLQPHGRYIVDVDNKQDLDDPGLAMYPLVFQGIIHDKTEREHMKGPGFTVAYSREADIDEQIDRWKSWSPIDPTTGQPSIKIANMQKRAPKNAKMGTSEIPFSELICDTIRKHGIRWAFQYYVLKGGVPPAQFKILAKDALENRE